MLPFPIILNSFKRPYEGIIILPARKCSDLVVEATVKILSGFLYLLNYLVSREYRSKITKNSLFVVRKKKVLFSF